MLSTPKYAHASNPSIELNVMLAHMQSLDVFKFQIIQEHTCVLTVKDT